MTVVRGRPIADLGLTTRWLGRSLALQIVFAGLQYAGTLAKTQLPSSAELAPLIGLARYRLLRSGVLAGLVLLRLEEAFWFIPAVVLKASPCTRRTTSATGCPPARCSSSSSSASCMQ